MSSVRTRTPALLVKDPQVLLSLEDRFSFAAMLGARGTNAAELLAASPGYRSLDAAVAGDVANVDASDTEAGKGFAFARRLFDDKWLESPQVRFELTGIANRIDLRHRGGCGEVHFVYRLAYTTFVDRNDPATKIDSRLPFTVNVLVPIPDDGAECASVAAKWLSVQPGLSHATPVR